MPEAKYKIAFNWGDRVFLVTDTERYDGIIIAIKKDWNGGVFYEVKFCDDSDWYQSVELILQSEVEGKKEKKLKPLKPDIDDEGNEGDIEK